MRTWLPLLVALSGCIENEFAPDTPNTRPYVPPDDDTIPDDVALGGVAGRICAPNGITWIVGAAVWVEHDYGTTLGYTDGDGRFEIAPIPAGRQVVRVSKGSFSTTFNVRILPDLIVDLPEQQCLATDLEIAVVTGRYDSVEDLLGNLGFTPTLIAGDTQTTALLRDPVALARYDVVFFNCGMSEGWVSARDEVAENLRDYVSAGGSIYASDWAYWVVESAFPDLVEFVGDDAVFRDALRGNRTPDPIQAIVRDPDMVTALDSVFADIQYELSDWADMAAAGDPDDVLIEGTTTWNDGFANHTITGPLAIRRHLGAGTVLFTSFHNESQPTRDMEILLHEIILSL